MVKFYRILLGMHEHPQSYEERGLKAPRGVARDQHQLLYPGDVVQVEEAFVMRPPAMGGWADPRKDGTWGIDCAVVVQAEQESYVLRDEPSRVAGINITQNALRRAEREESESESMAIPLPSVARQSSSQVKRVRA